MRLAALLTLVVAALLGGCRDTWEVEDGDGDGITAAEGDCWDIEEGPEGSGLSGADIHPGVAETWYDGVDQDCDGWSDYDQDLDGHESIEVQGDDCDDTEPAAYPGGTEVAYDGIDGDCDGWSDYDADGDGYDATAYGGGDCDDENPTINQAAAEIWYDGIDEDCDGGSDYDQDYDGYDSDDYAVGPEADCDDIDATAYPGNTEIWYDGTDGDCLGDSDYDADADGYDTLDYGGDDCDDTDALIFPDATETWYNGVDEDCSGGSDYDQDGDGYDSDVEIDTGTDCDDDREDVSPEILEVCNFRDDDCDDLTDEGFDALDATSYYADTDSDGYGDATDIELACDGYEPDGYVTDNTDCDDTDAATYPDAFEIVGDEKDESCDDLEDCYVNADADGYRIDTVVGSADVDCDDAGEALGSLPSDDCDDGSATVYPGATEVTGDEIDQSCDGSETCYVNADGDGYRVATTTTSADDDCDDSGEAASSVPVTDCDDGLASVYPGATEVTGDEIDENCDDKETCYVNADGDSYRLSTTTTSADDDCDDSGEAASSVTAGDCDDTNAAISPSATEICDSADTDEDCDGYADDDDSSAASAGKTTYYLDADSDGYGLSTSTVSMCDLPSGYSTLSTDCNDSSAAISPADAEICDSANTDEDCDGLADNNDSSAASSGKTTYYLDADSDGYGLSTSTTSTCDLPSGYSAVSTDCNDGSAAVSPGDTEICDSSNTDEDCDSLADDLDSSVASSGKTTYYLDADSDGYGKASSSTSKCDLPSGYSTLSTDCDDSTAAVSPADSEICDSADTDEDCDGDADDDDSSVASSGKTTWYLDADSDGYGKASSSTSKCDLPSGYVANSTDCDDSDETANPAGSEVCDIFDADEDCDGDADDDDSSVASSGKTTYYRDADGDSFGLLSSTTSACDLPTGYDTSSTDCDDGDDTTYPAAPETCEDAVVNDCDGSILAAQDECFNPTFDLGGAFADRTGEVAGDGAGSALAFVGDIDGNGDDDASIGAPAAASAKGRVYLIAGGFSSGSTALSVASVTARITGAAGESLGGSLAGTGDVDGDGFGDLLLGAPTANGGGSDSDSGAVYFLYGPQTGDVDVADIADATLIGAAGSDQAGSSVAGVGDVTGGGVEDLLLGAPGESSIDAGAGAAYLWAGPPTGGSLDSALAEAFFYGEAAGDGAGTCVAAAGDVDSDGTPDLLVGAPGASSAAGAAYLIYGPATGLVDLADADAIFSGIAASDAAGSSLAGGADVDGDGSDDLLIGAPGRSLSRGAAYLISGDTATTTALGAADAVLSGATFGDEAGAAVTLASDVDDDGFADLLLGAPSADGAAAASGAAYLFYGPLLADASLSAADVVFAGEAADDAAGSSLAGGGDPDGDGYGDLLLGAPAHDNGTGDDIGIGYLVLGTSY